MSEFQREILLLGAGVVLTMVLLAWSATTIRYRISPRHLLICWLGIPVRWIRLADIKGFGTRPVAWAEHWPSVLFRTGRTLVIRRRRGLFRHVLITPPYPFEFKSSLDQARRTVQADAVENVPSSSAVEKSRPVAPTSPAPGQPPTKHAA